MSHIFDGLQRSEAEHPDVDFSSMLGVTELLQHAERRVASNWETTLVDDCSGETIEDNRTPNDLYRARPVETSSGVPFAVEPSLTDRSVDFFDQLQSLQASVPVQGRLPCLSDSGSPGAEAFRLLGVRLQQLRRDPPLKRVVITSTIPREGKSTVSANVACTLASKTQQRTLLLEGDIRRPSLSQMFGVGSSPGLSEVLKDGRSLTKSIYYLEVPNIWMLPAGSVPSNPLKLLQSRNLAQLMDQLSVLFDWIIIDSPPVLPLADTSVWMRLADGILLTTRQGITDKRQLLRGLEAIESKKLVGAVVNCSQNMAANNYDYYSPAARLESNNAAADD